VGASKTWESLGLGIRGLPKRQRIRHLLEKLIHEHDSPRRLSLAIATGVFIGTLPLWGLHMWIGLLVAFLARLNKLAVFLGTQISLPWMIPILIMGSLQIGELIVHQRLLAVDASFLDLGRLPSLCIPWVVGSVVLGILLGGLSFGLSMYVLMRRRRSREQHGFPAQGPGGPVTQ
jgi:uncharacterized protein (DUF2062 family)